MGKGLIITEKPSVARDIVEALGGFTSKEGNQYWESDQYVCTYAVGHILSLLAPEDIDPTYKRWRLSDLPIIPKKFDIKPIEGQQQRLKVIEKLAKRKDVDLLINACDAAREGELIFREIVRYLHTDRPIERLWLQSLTTKAIQDGFKHLVNGEKYRGLADAAECRSYSDWLIGMNATRALTVRLKSRAQRGVSWSAGRVQTPTLCLLVNRELEILSHISQPYWKVEANFDAGSHTYQGTWFDPDFKKQDDKPELKPDRLFDEIKAKKIIDEIQNQKGIASETRRPKPRKPPLLFDLTSLQRDANRRFGWSAVRTLRAAQRCYETHKVLTYPRTSSRVLPNDYVNVVEQLITGLSQHQVYGPHAQYLQDRGRKNEDKIFDDAGVTDHFAIIPTGQFKILEGDDFKLFDLVTRQFLAAFYPPAIYEEIERLTVVNSHQFKSKPPLVLKDPGWQAVFEKQAASSEEKAFPPLVQGKDEVSGVAVKTKEAQLEVLETKPPARISEAGLLGLMENAGRQVEDEELATALQKAEGLGTAATRAEIIENLKNKEYVDHSLRPTVKGIRLIDILRRIHADRLTSAELTAQLELHLHQVERGKRTAKQFMEEIAEYATEVVEATRSFEFEGIYPEKDPLGKCPKCGRPVYERAWFYGCPESTKRTEEKKDCDFLIWKDLYGRYMGRENVRTLLEKGETRELDGFRGQDGQTYKAKLVLDGGKIIRKSIESSGEQPIQPIEVNHEPLGTCPLHKDRPCLVIETPKAFVCELKQQQKEGVNYSSCGFAMPRSICKREMQREEVINYMENRETAVLNDFISKKGRKFSAKLKLQENGGFSFEFPERKPKPKKKVEGSEKPKEDVTESPF